VSFPAAGWGCASAHLSRHGPHSGTAAPAPACRWHGGAYWHAGRSLPARRTGAAFVEGAGRPPPSSAAFAAGGAAGTPAARPRVLVRAGPLFSPAGAAPDDAPPSATAPPHLAWAAATPRSARHPPAARRRHPAPASGSAESPARPNRSATHNAGDRT